MSRSTAQFRFYEELNDFLPPARRKVAFDYEFDGTPSVKDAIEAIGVPHPEVDLILVTRNGPAALSVDFSFRIANGDRVTVYPVFESFDISAVTHLRPRPLRRTRFLLDVHLGKLARILRLLGFDSVYERDYDDAEIARRTAAEKRVVLTRDKGLLKRSEVTRGYWLRSQDPEVQAREVLGRFDLESAVAPYSRCLVCNGTLAAAEESAVTQDVPPKSRRMYDAYTRCESCGRIYWRGTHATGLTGIIERILKKDASAPSS